MLSVRDLRKSFDGVTALGGLSFDLFPEKISAMVGPNGSGKTTLINVVCGAIEPDTGSVLLDGKDLTRLPMPAIARQGVGRAYQHARIFPHISVQDHLQLALQSPDMETLGTALFRPGRSQSFKERIEDRISAILRRTELTDKRDARAGALSHGQQRLLSLGMAMIRTPSILLLDEPTAGVHPEIVETIKTMIRDFQDAEHAILFIEHDLAFVRDIAQRVLVLDNGKLIADGSLSEVRTHPSVQQISYGSL
jgi:ABC-type branched-subunit amino acid transport system ATPase component